MHYLTTWLLTLRCERVGWGSLSSEHTILVGGVIRSFAPFPRRNRSLYATRITAPRLSRRMARTFGLSSVSSEPRISTGTMKSILFIDPPAFCTTVLAMVDPALRRRPVAVAPPGADRAVLLALSPEARRAGLERGTPVRLAMRICPDLIICPPDPHHWARAHKAMHRILSQVAPVIEPRGWGHSYLDISGTAKLFGPPVDVARRLERELLSKLNLPVAVGIAINKLVSETAATVVKREAGAEIWPVAAGCEEEFLAPEHVTLLPEIPDRMRARLSDYHLELIGEVASLGAQPLQVAFGRTGRSLHRHAQGIDLRPVLPPAVKAECKVEHVLATDTNDKHELRRLLQAMSERLGRRLRQRGYAAGRLLLTIRHADDSISRRKVPLAACTLDVELWRSACRALDKLLVKRIAVRSIAIVADDLQHGHGQFELWDDPVALSQPEAAALQKAVDGVRRVLRRDPILPAHDSGPNTVNACSIPLACVPGTSAIQA
jgi:DNA polymerase-4